MATIDRYKIVLDVDGQQAVDRLKNSVAGLGAAMASIGFGAFLGGAIRMADQMNDVADATGIAVGKIAALGQSIQQAGGNFDDVGKIVTTFYNNLEAAASGSDKAVEALEKLNIVQSDLTRLSEGQLLQKAIDELAKMEAGAKRTAIGVEVFGKAFRNIDPKKLQDLLATKDVAQLEQELKKVGDAADAMQATFSNFQMAAVKVLGQLTGNTDSLVISMEKAETIIKAVGIALGVMLSAKIILTIVEVTSAILTLNKALMGTAVVANLLGKNPLIKIFAGIAVAAGVGAIAFNEYEKALKDAEQAQKDLNASSPAGTTAPTVAGNRPAFAETQETAKAKALRMAADAAKQTTLASIEQNKQANEYQKIIIGTIGYEGNLAQLIQANAQAEQDAANKKQELQKQIAAETIKGKDANAGVIAELQKQTAEVDKQLSRQKVLNAERLIALNKQREFSLELQRTSTIDTRQVELDLIQKQIEGTTAVTIQEQNALKLLQLEAQEKQRLIALDTELKAAIEARDQIAIDNINKRKQDEISYYATLRDLENKRMEQEIANRNNRDLGIKRAMEQIERNFDPIKIAADQTTLLFDRMGQGLEEFVKTGKLNFKDFALSLIRDLLLIQIKAQAMNFLKGMMGGGGLFGGAIIPGLLAEGGPATPGKPYIVGEKGPELFVPKSAGTVIPNNQMTGNRGMATGAVNAPITNNYITNNVNAIDSQSVAQFFANNRKLMLGSVEMARKEMPYGMSR